MPSGRAQLAADTSLTGRRLCTAWTAQVDDWFRALYAEAAGARPGMALVALGGYGRRELSLQSDLDVLLLHTGGAEVPEVADALWYPVWDAGLKLGHAVRTAKEALGLAADDLDTATSLLQARHVAGDPALTADLTARALELWQRRAKRFLAEMRDRVDARHRQAGEVAFLLEPDLKEGRGGLRDVHSLHWAGQARQILWEGDDATLAEAYGVLLDVRVELHRHSGRPGDRLTLQDQDAVAGAFRIDADELMRRVSSAARTIAWRSDDTWRRIGSSLRGPLGRIARRDRPVGEGLVLRDGELHAAEGFDCGADPVAALRAAAVAAEEGVPFHRSLLAALDATPPMPDPWPEGAREALVRLLAAGRAAIPLVEALDQHHLFARALPEWETVRSKPQRNAYHTFTVDRHLCEAAANASELIGRVGRPDLLLVGTLLHDLGKGLPGDHTEVGMELVDRIGRRMGFPPDDVDVLVAMVEHHLLLPDVATRRDLDDAETISRVAAQVGALERLHLLHALTESDSLATGPSAWGGWKAELVAGLVRRTEHVLGGGEVEEVTGEFPTEEQLVMLRGGRRVLQAEGDRLTVIDVDRPGLLSRVTGVLALHGLDVLDADVATIEGRALEQLRVQSAFGPTVAWEKVLADLQRALDGRLAIRARLADRAATYARRPTGLAPRRPSVTFHPDDSSIATVLEVRAEDAVGLLHRITAALADFDLTIVSARVQTMGPEVIDAFYVQESDGTKLSEELWPELRRALEHAITDARGA